MYTVRLTEEFRGWLRTLRDIRAKTKIVSRLRLAAKGCLGDWSPVCGCVSEMRVNAGSGYRLYFMRRERVIVVMLVGGDKSSQKRDIERALDMAMHVESER